MAPTIIGETPRRYRFRGMTLRFAIVMIAILGAGLGAYRHYQRHVRQRTIAYPVADLLPAGSRGGTSRMKQDFAPLMASIRSEVLPRTWQGQGGSGTIVEFFLNDSLIVRNNQVGHERLTMFLREKRSAR